MANRNFEVTGWQEWGTNIVVDIRVLSSEYRYLLENASWIQKIIRKPWFTAQDLEKIEDAATEYRRIG